MKKSHKQNEKAVNRIISITVCFVLMLSLFYAFPALKANALIDEMLTVQSITAGSWYVGGKHDLSLFVPSLVGSYGLTPANPTNISETLFARLDPVGDDCWHTNNDSKDNAWLLIDFGQSQEVDKIYIWNFNRSTYGGRDIKDITITYSANSTDGEDGDWIVFGDSVIPQSLADSNPATPHLILDFYNEARFIKIKANSSYGDANYWGLGKLAFVHENENKSAVTISGVVDVAWTVVIPAGSAAIDLTDSVNEQPIGQLQVTRANLEFGKKLRVTADSEDWSLQNETPQNTTSFRYDLTKADHTWDFTTVSSMPTDVKLIMTDTADASSPSGVYSDIVTFTVSYISD